MQHFTRLKVWQRSHALALEIYKVTRYFPKDERYGLISQLRRAAVSAPTNLAEGSKRQHRRDYVRFINTAEASLSELEYLLILSRDLGFLDEDRTLSLIRETDEIARMMNRLRAAVEAWIE